jgi:AcrR family transcriptional regulator
MYNMESARQQGFSAREPEAPRRRRPRNSLSLGEVVDAAIGVVEERGLSALTIRSVAERLGASPMSVYNYVENREALELAMLEQATSGLPVEVEGTDPLARLTTRLRGLHDHLARYRWALQLVTSGDLVPTNSFRFADACIGEFIALGLAPATAIYSYGACWHLVLGELLDRHPGPTRKVDGRTQREQALRSMNSEEYPNYVRVLGVLDPSDAPPPCHFDRTLDILLHGLLAAGRESG